MSASRASVCRCRSVIGNVVTSPPTTSSPWLCTVKVARDLQGIDGAPGVGGEQHAGPGARTEVAEHHRLHDHSRAPLIGELKLLGTPPRRFASAMSRSNRSRSRPWPIPHDWTNRRYASHAVQDPCVAATTSVTAGLIPTFRYVARILSRARNTSVVSTNPSGTRMPS